MYIIEMTSRHKNDFHFIAHCGFCDKKSSWGDGYADHYYQQVVFPNRSCPHCGINSFGDVADGDYDAAIREPALLVLAKLLKDREEKDAN